MQKPAKVAASDKVVVSVEKANDRREGLAYLFACTTSERVEEFFVRNGFRAVGPEGVPKAKWQSYDPERRSQTRCLRIDL